jgi:hypothetical protein
VGVPDRSWDCLLVNRAEADSVGDANDDRPQIGAVDLFRLTGPCGSVAHGGLGQSSRRVTLAGRLAGRKNNRTNSEAGDNESAGLAAP